MKHTKDIKIFVGTMKNDKGIAIDLIATDGSPVCCINCYMKYLKAFTDEWLKENSFDPKSDELH